jgi:hypothetical protein
MMSHRQDDQQQDVERYNVSTLKSLSLIAVRDHKNHLILSRADDLKNLRKK